MDFFQPDSEPIEATFELSDTLYAKAHIPPTEEVYLWLGANVMLAYPIPEAEDLLNTRLATAKKSLANCEEDLDFLREQITVIISLFFFVTWHTNVLCRRLRWQQQESTIGISLKRGKKRQSRRSSRRGRTRADLEVERHCDVRIECNA